MPMEQVHFWTRENIDTYSDLIAAEGGADVAYTALSWSGGIGAIDAESFPAETMDELMAMGSRYVTPMPEMLAHDSLRGMFGLSGDIASVPPYAVTVGPKDLAAAKCRIHVQYLTACGGFPAHQKYPLKLSLLGPISPKNPGSMMRLMSGFCYISADVAAPVPYEQDVDWLEEKINEIRKQEATVLTVHCLILNRHPGSLFGTRKFWSAAATSAGKRWRSPTKTATPSVSFPTPPAP